jgi:hypothetical protein
VPLAACTSWRLERLSATPPARPPATVRVTRTDGISIVLYKAQVTRDSVIGYQTGRVALHRSSVRWLEYKRFEKGRTIALAVFATPLVVFLVFKGIPGV